MFADALQVEDHLHEAIHLFPVEGLFRAQQARQRRGARRALVAQHEDARAAQLPHEAVGTRRRRLDGGHEGRGAFDAGGRQLDVHQRVAHRQGDVGEITEVTRVLEQLRQQACLAALFLQRGQKTGRRLEARCLAHAAQDHQRVEGARAHRRLALRLLRRGQPLAVLADEEVGAVADPGSVVEIGVPQGVGIEAEQAGRQGVAAAQSHHVLQGAGGGGAIADALRRLGDDGPQPGGQFVLRPVGAEVAQGRLHDLAWRTQVAAQLRQQLQHPGPGFAAVGREQFGGHLGAAAEQLDTRAQQEIIEFALAVVLAETSHRGARVLHLALAEIAADDQAPPLGQLFAGGVLLPAPDERAQHLARALPLTQGHPRLGLAGARPAAKAGGQAGRQRGHARGQSRPVALRGENGHALALPGHPCLAVLLHRRLAGVEDVQGQRRGTDARQRADLLEARVAQRGGGRAGGGLGGRRRGGGQGCAQGCGEKQAEQAQARRPDAAVRAEKTSLERGACHKRKTGNARLALPVNVTPAAGEDKGRLHSPAARAVRRASP